MSTFLDTSALLAVLDQGDRQHSAVAEAWTRLQQSQGRLVTTNYVVLESLAICQRRFGVDAVRLLVEDFLPLLEIAWVDEDVHGQALNALFNSGRRDLSLVDCVSFVVMRRLGIGRAFTLDRHFQERGFECVP